MTGRAIVASVGFIFAAACVPADASRNTVVTAPRPSVSTPAAPPTRPIPVGASGTGSAVLLARVDGHQVAYVADPDDGLIVTVDAESLTPLSVLDAGGAPAQILLTRRGRLFATLRDKDELVAIEGTGIAGDPLRVVRRTATGSEPIGLAATPDQATVLVAAGWGHSLDTYDAETLVRRFSQDLGREPRDVTVSDDGLRAFVSHAVGPDVDVVELSSHKAKRVSMEVKESGASVRRGAVTLRSGQAFALAKGVAPAGRIFVPHARIRTTLVDGSFEGYGSPQAGPTEEFDIGVFDEDSGKPLAGSLDTAGGLACVLPRAAVATVDGQLLVACVGTSEVIGMDAAAANPHEAVIQRWRVPQGPMGIAVDDARPRALVWSQFDHALSWILLQGRDGFVLAFSRLPRTVARTAELDRGRVLFHLSDKRISLDGRACASCHPDGRDDGLVWSTPDGPRNPPMLAGRLDSAEPYGWLGGAPDVPSHLKETFLRLGARTGKKGLDADDRSALVAYLTSMKAPRASVPNPADPFVAEGRRIYESSEAGCEECHGRVGGAPDGLRHNVLSWARGDRSGIFDTPSLRFVGGTAPYFHDGRYPTLRSLLTHTRKSMGQDRPLSPAQLDALEAYVRTL